MEHHPAFPLIQTRGTPRERGRLYGEQARDRIRGSVDLYMGSLGKRGLTRDDVLEMAAGFAPRIRDWAPDLMEEIEGIAEGADLAQAEIVLINARTEVLQLADRRTGTQPDPEPDGCTGAVVLPGATDAGHLIHGQNWDWRAECADTSVVLKVERDDGPDFLTFTEAGGLARSGMNAAGISITANYLECDRDYRGLGIPLPLIRRRALEAAHFAHAIRVVAVTPKSGSNNMMLGYAGGFAVNLECAPDESFAIYPDAQGLIVHANHWLHNAALSKLKDTGLDDVPDSLYRDARVRHHLDGRADLTVEDLKTALMDRFADPYGVCRPPLQKGNGNLSATVAMVLMEPALGVMDIAPLPAVNDTFTRYRLDMDLRD
ncbi:C45 family autoproteolytic acyltransferase/hydolase [Chachezhania sediminis]|uniref:C45 family autoproteolytic acyltransferase/hydolase n=1 Tax=Chachezhania sediminis TaxID=2599291 RepID=UPI00131BCE53|nr:C45 family peptidase [Chachezhania sediminis]